MDICQIDHFAVQTGRGGEMTTRLIRFNDSPLSPNYSTSAARSIRV